MEFTAPQNQEELDAIINDAVGKATTGIRSKMSEEHDAFKNLKSEFDVLKAKTDEAEKAAQKAASEKEQAELLAQGKFEEALKSIQDRHTTTLSDMQTKLEGANERIKSLVVDHEILKHAANAIDTQDVLMLVKSAYRFEVTDSGVNVKTLDGLPVMDDKGIMGGIEMAVKQFLATKPHLVRADAQGGAGTKPGDNTDPSKMTIDEQISQAYKDGNRTLAIKLKAQRMSTQGPYSLRKKSGG